MRIAIASDHAGFPHKGPVAQALAADGHDILDLGTDSEEPVDYPDYARRLGDAVRDGAADAGVLLCGSGAGASIAANKLRGIRAALAHDLYTARQAREDDDANVLCLGARVIDVPTAITLARAFLGAKFSGLPRHVRRVRKIAALEAEERGEYVQVRDGSAKRALTRLDKIDAARRLWGRDTSLWSDDPSVRAAIARHLAWLDTPRDMAARLGELRTFADEVSHDGIRAVVLLGMGGSSLAPEVFALTFGAGPGAPSLTVLDTTDPDMIRETRVRLELPRTLFIVASKSGTTVESNVLYRYFRGETDHAVGAERAGRHFVAITDPATPLARLAADARFRRVFLNDPGVGGRFSALSYFGLVPAALLGVEVHRLLATASAMAARCGAVVPIADNPGLLLGGELAGHALAGRDKVTLAVSRPVRSLGAWLEQLLTESTGKQGKGLIVVDGEPLGPPAAYGDDRLFVGITLGEDADVLKPLAALEAAGHPVIRFTMADRYDMGAEFFRWEVATAAAGALLELNPFDEPNVAQAKEATQSALATFREQGQLPEWPADEPDDLAGVLAEARPGDYVTLLAYVPASADTTAALQRLRLVVRDRTRLATTLGYGPRYLHSTGQLHKGGPSTPILAILTAGGRAELPIPGEPYGFATLQMAQALGDLATLRGLHRRALWLPLDGADAAAIDRVAAALARRLDARART